MPQRQIQFRISEEAYYLLEQELGEEGSVSNMIKAKIYSHLGLKPELTSSQKRAMDRWQERAETLQRQIEELRSSHSDPKDNLPSNYEQPEDNGYGY